MQVLIEREDSAAHKYADELAVAFYTLLHHDWTNAADLAHAARLLLGQALTVAAADELRKEFGEDLAEAETRQVAEQFALKLAASAAPIFRMVLNQAKERAAAKRNRGE